MLGTLTDAQIDRLLHTESVGRIGCHAGGRPYVVPVTYVYDGSAIYGHTGDGMKVRMMRENPAVCFEVDRMESLAN
jgi:nitroimidazol reductase NimA-like FMN-containing flavoprotein (pyridoxamine 5'-phosphate oxidase superfamily)